jgi:hypothetical protein
LAYGFLVPGGLASAPERLVASEAPKGYGLRGAGYRAIPRKRGSLRAGKGSAIAR